MALTTIRPLDPGLSGDNKVLLEAIQAVFDATEEVHTGLTTVSGDVDMLRAEAVGSWSWDKKKGLMTMFNEAGTPVAKFTVSDTPEVSVRERRQDLEL